MYTGAKYATYLTTIEHGFAEREDTEFNKYFIFPYYIFEKTMFFFPMVKLLSSCLIPANKSRMRTLVPEIM